jgi:hypothetical protein
MNKPLLSQTIAAAKMYANAYTIHARPECGRDHEKTSRNLKPQPSPGEPGSRLDSVRKHHKKARALTQRRRKKRGY